MGNSLRSDRQDFSKVLTFQWIYIERATHAKKEKKMTIYWQEFGEIGTLVHY